MIKTSQTFHVFINATSLGEAQLCKYVHATKQRPQNRDFETPVKPASLTITGTYEGEKGVFTSLYTIELVKPLSCDLDVHVKNRHVKLGKKRLGKAGHAKGVLAAYA